MTWKKRTPVERAEIPGCATFNSRPLTLDLEFVIAVGFGQALVLRDDDQIYSEPTDPGADLWTLQDAEIAALADPDHDWRVVFQAPLSSSVYQRQGAGYWVLVEQGRGFA
jgi:hypothetical protein